MGKRGKKMSDLHLYYSVAQKRRKYAHGASSKEAIQPFRNNAVFEGLLPGQREWRWGLEQDRQVTETQLQMLKKGG